MEAHSYEVMERRFAKAARHSRRVRFLRKAVPAVVVVSMALIVGVSVFNPFRLLAGIPLSVGNLAVSGTKITMDSPHLTGFTPDQRPYDLRAKTAIQDVTDPVHVELQQLTAKVQMEDKSTVNMDAKSGLFDTKAQTLDLKDNIFLQSSTGYEARLTQARVDFGKGTVASDQPVAVKLLNGTLDANRLRITENGALVVFDQGVSMILIPDQQPPSGAASSDAAAHEDVAPPAKKK
ncbi:LPS export ABC transporter periplasmic protein LptC [Bradyrhizobium sp. U87765 SZCCT0131]|uniref:LPS export ABC transporter periplasmic protein LptC n=1 Tax=unclassified Bradyrhizobium TaxID=2631580 RepID=UPI001BABAB9F|nr:MULTISPECIES: LPS export ABC transporter periplasmic protein LptC [unclassified Bradyrhizobium]MBR1216738.1 LPS export ABC transporter periplasmic protein LptC [Bradyrhizobium sp. U87765 SZCCT0131]MBR1259506.1 LPS export ABC transporter periplasmic protein LptC [Bradyrhizobium sp. U87765 SZCCT0134]MBR1305647.1 LPS export ABC transporter periplasmic protein LptC [Bradyrhizobium sp. U87765 SZCCT0110]MBR1322014.1 LPS export ABC transporter periplasmic protein LptC [Bradyrhizobium sp. U87765 SZC